MEYIYIFFGGRSTTAFWFLFGVGAVLAFQGKLTGDYVALAGTLHGFIVARAISEDHHADHPAFHFLTRSHEGQPKV